MMKQYGLGPNGGILTASNLFATRFDQVGACTCSHHCALQHFQFVLQSSKAASCCLVHSSTAAVQRSQSSATVSLVSTLLQAWYLQGCVRLGAVGITERSTCHVQQLDSAVWLCTCYPPSLLRWHPATPTLQVIQLLEKPRDPALKYVFVDTPGQIEIFTWSASGQLITGTHLHSAAFCTTALQVGRGWYHEDVK